MMLAESEILGLVSPDLFEPNFKPQKSLDVSTGILKNAFMIYATFLVTGSMVFHALGGDFSHTDMMDRLCYLSTFLEACGLLALRMKIQREDSVAGISGQTMIVYACAYTLRVCLTPSWSWTQLNSWAMEVLEIFALLLVLDILRCIFKTHRETYQSDMEGIKAYYLVPGCVLFALVLHPDVHQGGLYNLVWTSCLYTDTTALLSQLFMMSRMGSEVEAPIANFVAATALSRGVDIWYWTYAFKLVAPRGGGFNYSGWLIVVFHCLHSVLLCDFMYFWLKSRWNRGLLAKTVLSKDGLYEEV